jgi:hypothetical protein
LLLPASRAGLVAAADCSGWEPLLRTLPVGQGRQVTTPRLAGAIRETVLEALEAYA